jgi:hypothetical protein
MNMKGICTVCLCSMVVAGAAMAAKVPVDGGPQTPAGDCPVDGYKSYGGAGGDIPDGAGTIVTFGPVAVADDGSTFDDVVLSLDLDHTWVGDLRIALLYDTNCDGAAEAGPVAALCRPGLDGCDLTGCCGCSGDIAGSYFFSDSAGDALGETDCPSFIPAGCYSAAVDSPAPFAVFDGLAKGGCFWLEGTDGAGGDIAVFRGWTVYAANGGGGTPVENTTWGALKATY